MSSKSNWHLAELHTEILKVDPHVRDPKAARRVVDVLNAGGIVAMRTDTVYGLLARVNRPDALRKLSALKRRPPEKPFLMLAGDWRAVRQLTSHLPAIARHLGSQHWPGPLTLILPAAKNLPAEIVGSGSTVAVRIPGDAFLLSVLQELKGIVAAPSANLPGEPPISTAEEASQSFGNEIDLFVEGGPPSGDLPSTLVSCIGEHAQVLREGSIVLTAQDLEL